MAPDKIYLQHNTTTDLYDEFWPEWFEGTHHPERDICYIRKDALLEWAKKKNKRIDAEEGDYSLGYVSAMIDLIEKIESL